MFSQMFAKTKLSTPQNEIGEIVPVLAGANNNSVTANTQGKFIKTGSIYNIADYPELYAKIGSVGASQYTPRTSGTTSTLYAVTYGNGKYFAGGTGGALVTSTDGITWATTTSPTTATIWTLLYGNGLYIIGENNGSSGTIRSSTDGITWTTRASGIARVVSGSYSEGIFIIGGNIGVYTSTNGTTWTTYTFSSGMNIQEVLYANGKYLAFGGGGNKTSTDAINWVSVQGTTSGGLGVNSLVYGNGIYLCGENNAATFNTSTDAITWTLVSDVGSTIDALAYNNGLFIGAYFGLKTSTNGTTWNTIQAGTSSAIWAITYGNGLYVYVGAGGLLGTSGNSITPEYSTYYDFTTQFYVPSYATGTRYYTLPTYGSNTAPTTVNYIRAK